MTQKKLICIVCPLGCSIEVKSENGKIIDITGNSCPRGKKYVEAECTNPVRTITTTMRCDNGEVVSVKTDRPVMKSVIFECMDIINSKKIHLPISIGSVIIKNVAGTGANVVATQNKQQRKS